MGLDWFATPQALALGIWVLAAVIAAGCLVEFAVRLRRWSRQLQQIANSRRSIVRRGSNGTTVRIGVHEPSGRGLS